MKLLLVLLLVCSCGRIRHDINGVPDKVKVDIPSDFTVGPDFAKAAKFCDERYGVKTPEAEACFIDYRDYTKLKLSLDLNAIKAFCEESYGVGADVEKCITDLINLFNNSLNPKTGSI